ncbi:hypothetical protein Tco_0790691 [Tanacetum coccineum]
MVSTYYKPKIPRLHFLNQPWVGTSSPVKSTINLIRIIPGPAGIVQTTKLRKIADTREGGEESVMSIQEYIRKVIEDVGEDDNFTRAPWLSVVGYVNVDGGIVTGYFRDAKKFL